MLHRVAETIEHTVIDVVREGDHDGVVMADVSDVLLPPDVRITPSELDRLLGGLARLHASFEGCPPDGLCSPSERNSLFIPAFQRGDGGPKRVHDP